MNTPNQPSRGQAGYLLLEVLVAILVFAIGVLGVVSLHAVSVKNAGSAKYRTDASFLANQLLGQMWADDRDPDKLKAAYEGKEGKGGARYEAWVGNVQSLLPGVTVANQPEVAVATVESKSPLLPPPPDKSLVTITLRWQVPGDVDDKGNPVEHKFTAVDEIPQ